MLIYLERYTLRIISNAINLKALREHFKKYRIKLLTLYKMFSQKDTHFKLYNS